MPRNKTAKRTAKRHRMIKPLANTQKIEMDFMGAPAKIIAQLNKDVTVLKQKEIKLIAAVNKIKAQVNKCETRIKSAEKAKNASARKKQLKIAKNEYSETLKAQKELIYQHKEIIELRDAASEHHNKMVALSKHLSQFDKEWAKKSKQMKAEKKAKLKAKPKKESAKTRTMSSIVELQQIEAIEPTIDNVRLDEATTEMAS